MRQSAHRCAMEPLCAMDDTMVEMAWSLSHPPALPPDELPVQMPLLSPAVNGVPAELSMGFLLNNLLMIISSMSSTSILPPKHKWWRTATQFKPCSSSSRYCHWETTCTINVWTIYVAELNWMTRMPSTSIQPSSTCHTQHATQCHTYVVYSVRSIDVTIDNDPGNCSACSSWIINATWPNETQTNPGKSMSITSKVGPQSKQHSLTDICLA